MESVPDIPVTVKMRGGWNNNNIISTEAGILMEKIGVAANDQYGLTEILNIDIKNNSVKKTVLNE